jgi:Na+/melibiose symporter-like transporter
MRQFILLLIFLFILEMFLIDARGPSMYLFLRKQFQWDAATFGQFLAFLGIIGLLTQYVAVPVLTGWVGLRDSTLAGVAMITVLGELIIWAFATEGWHIYAGGTIAGMR